MSKTIRFCCSTYTLQETCPKCGKPAVSPAPAKYSPQDKYAAYRRKYKEELAQNNS